MTENTQPDIDIVIPVYRDCQVTRACLESVLKHTEPETAGIIVVDDASPDTDLVGFCDQLAREGKVKLLRHEVNQGFVHSVNEGMAQNEDRDVVLLNSDTRVPPGWLERLRRCASQGEDVATVTPFSNNASICSYPHFGRSGEIPAGMTLEQLDSLFREANAGESCEIPTGIGFCLYITRRCLDQLGFFDADLFGKGYGEENDFCWRASQHGWRNLACADLYIYHQGAASFGQERDTRMTAAEEILRSRYADYEDAIVDFVNRDPLSRFRHAVDRLRLELPGQPELVVSELQEDARIQQRRVGALQTALAAHVQRCHDYEERCQNYDKQLHRLRQEASETATAYERQLGECREQFQQTDEALREAQRVAAEQQEQLTELYRIKSSRFWRYSRWIRKLLDPT